MNRFWLGLQAIVVVVTIVLLTSCDPTLPQSAAAMQKEFGIPVVLQADATDDCVSNQAKALVKEFESLSKDEQAKYQKEIQSDYSKIILPSTSYSSTGAEVRYVLRLLQGDVAHCEYNDTKCQMNGGEVVAAKELKGGQSTQTAVNVQSEALKTDTLTIDVRGTSWTIATTTYTVRDSRFYDEVGSVDQLQGSIQPEDGITEETNQWIARNCVEPLKLKDLLK